MFIIFLAIIALLVFLLVLKISFCIIYSDDTFKVYVKVLGRKFDMAREKDQKEEKEKEKPEKSNTDHNHKLNTLIRFYKTNIRYIKKALKRIVKKVVVEKLTFVCVLGLDDAAQTALAYGSISAIFYNFYAYVHNHFTVKQEDVRISPDFDNQVAEVMFEGIFTLRVVNIINAMLALLPVFINYKKLRWCFMCLSILFKV